MEYNKILIIIRRSNGDVFLTIPLIEALKKRYSNAIIDILVNKNTTSIAKTLPFINTIHIFDYRWKKQGILSWIKNEFRLIRNIYKKYDLVINLTANDRNVLYAFLAGKESISAIESEFIKSWWKKNLVSYHYTIDNKKHMIYSILTPLNILGIKIKKIPYKPKVIYSFETIKNKFSLDNKYILFHPSAQFWFRTYPIELINSLLSLCKELNIQIVLSGGKDEINKKISKEIKNFPYVKNLISKTSIEELYALIKYSQVYIGMDTLTTHIAASFNKKLIAIYGPNSVIQWGPFNPELQYSPSFDTPPITRYGNFTIIQADMKCVPCNKNGCQGSGKSKCLYNIHPQTIFKEVKNG